MNDGMFCCDSGGFGPVIAVVGHQNPIARAYSVRAFSLAILCARDKSAALGRFAHLSLSLQNIRMDLQ
jgi:hypothetical protein